MELAEMLENMPGGIEVATRDFALLTLAAQLSATFPRQLVFKGGFVLRHVHGILRFSKDIDATRDQPPGQKLAGEKVAKAIREANIHNIVRFIPDEPATDSARSLDFDDIQVIGETFPSTSVQVEISYREAVIDEPVLAYIGKPFYESFEILTMAVEEMAAEKLRALAQRLRVTDLADLAIMFGNPSTSDQDIARLAASKFVLVAKGHANRIERIERNLYEMADTYDVIVPGLAPDTPPYRQAMNIVWPRITKLIP
jgi:predicted nucleotidyltransferase component of viral defense system